MSKRWINTSVEYQWSDELGELVQLSKEGYWYEGEMALCTTLSSHNADEWGWHFRNNWNMDSSVFLCSGDAYGINTSIQAQNNTSTYHIQCWDHNNNTTAFKICGNGDVGIGTGTPSYKLEVVGSFYSSGSSIEYKQEVEPYTPPEGALMSLKPVQYQYKDAWKDFGKRYAGNSSKQLGFVAEDVAKILPELAVTKTEDGEEVVRNVDYEKLTVLLVSEVQSLRKEVNDLKRSGANNSRPETTTTQSDNATTPS